MHHDMRGRQLHRAAVREAAHGNIGAAMALQGASNRQHMIASYQRCAWNPWYASNWMVRRAIRRDLVRTSYTLALASSIPIHETIVVCNPQNQLVILPPGSNVNICAQHVVVDLPEVVQVVFNQDGRQTTLFADRKCTRCGQYFFCYPNDAPPPYVIPGQPPAQVYQPPPAQVYQPPPAQPYQPPPSGPSAPTGMQICGNCHQQSPITAKFCGFCATKFAAPCAYCEAPKGNGSFCTNCGKPY
jgi:hypothetical protein